MNDISINREKMRAAPETSGKYTRRELLKKASPLGRVTIDVSRCTACGLCAANCPTGALSFVADDGETTYRLLFLHRLCVACETCAKACPEQCLSLERTFDAEKLGETPEVLFEDEIVRCTQCGKAFTSRVMIDRMKARLGIAERGAAAYFERCPECRVNIRFYRTGE